MSRPESAFNSILKYFEIGYTILELVGITTVSFAIRYLGSCRPHRTPKSSAHQPDGLDCGLLYCTDREFGGEIHDTVV
jgi:hypothetical protein